MDELERITADAAGGDPLAAAALVRATQSDVWRLCAALGDRATADDLTQETYLRAFGSLHRFENRSSVRTWLLAIARRVCADAVRSRRRRRLTQVRDDADLETPMQRHRAPADGVAEGAAVAEDGAQPPDVGLGGPDERRRGQGIAPGGVGRDALELVHDSIFIGRCQPPGNQGASADD